MEATIVDLRYKMSDILKALERNEEVKILYHGRLKGIIVSRVQSFKMKVSKHPFFNMQKDKSISVDKQMERLRGGRY